MSKLCALKSELPHSWSTGHDALGRKAGCSTRSQLRIASPYPGPVERGQTGDPCSPSEPQKRGSAWQGLPDPRESAADTRAPRDLFPTVPLSTLPLTGEVRGATLELPSSRRSVLSVSRDRHQMRPQVSLDRASIAGEGVQRPLAPSTAGGSGRCLASPVSLCQILFRCPGPTGTVAATSKPRVPSLTHTHRADARVRGLPGTVRLLRSTCT